jgi:ornithine cyclodeaminase
MSTPQLITLGEMKTVLPEIDLLEEMRSGFIAYSNGECVIPPVGELILNYPAPGEVHIKYGYVRGGDRYVIKIASGFPMNRELGIHTSNGMMILFNQRTGELEALLHDEGFLTDVRTAAAGALASCTMAPSSVTRIGIIGTGVQARMQLQQVTSALDCVQASVWGRNLEQVSNFVREFNDSGIEVEAAPDVRELLQSCEVVITCTSASEPLVLSEWVRPGTHITAVGSDTPEKQELDAALLGKADRVIVDSLDQGRLRGEVAHALRAGVLEERDVTELGTVLGDPSQGRSSDDQITVADLTGVAVQDLRIAEAVARLLERS